MRKPKWQKDAYLNTLDLYFKLELGEIHARNQDLVKPSAFLNKLPIYKLRPDKVKFRNLNRISLKLGNFKKLTLIIIERA